ncbi:hypothetical protein EMIHUDRAFT_208190 [Emiliania huxleyi CCMP1516]|uniref:Uncharacterized protein n=2 Tax=Emiliania huxleyi TaxID=2903 RepID=A0A0D3JC23_EMIH1|nr:hypothetical protein EMIHUDRAFT_208190 [Emiliania huxleyi CCMP1516]EOD21058.1 hypothetical protein EMIHUDRAFT_208190 [Emiliania huxleyi CCMP1516]|eukprot:XP_005773487.1 hypothetical protein EMIHUDRAFT_208190 [Emiliania huxleyi CCMP1516]
MEAYGAASSDEEELAPTGGRPRLHDRVRTLKPRGVWPTCITITPDDAHLVSGAWPNTIQVWRLGDGRLVRTLGIQVWGFEDEQGCHDEGMKEQGPTYKAWYMRSPKRNNYISLHENERGAEEDTFTGWWEGDFYEEPTPPAAKPHHHKGEIVSIAASDTRIISVGTIWCTPTSTFSHGDPTGGPAGYTKLWDLQTGEWLRDLGGRADALDISNDQSRAAVAFRSDVKIVALSNGDLLRRVKADPGLYDVALSYDNASLYMHGRSGVAMRDLARGGYLQFEGSRLLPMWRTATREDCLEWNECCFQQRRAQNGAEAEVARPDGRNIDSFCVKGQGGTLTVLSSGVVVATDGKSVACWSRAGSLLQERSLGDPTTYDPDARYFTPDGGSCESFCLAPDATEVLFGGEGGDLARFEVVAKSCESENSGEVIAKMRVGGPRFTGRVSQIAFSRSGQYVANLNTSAHGELDPRIPVWRGQRFLDVRAEKVVRTRLDPLVRLLLLVRTGRAELITAATSSADTTIDGVGLLSKLVTADGGEPGLASIILRQLSKGWLQTTAVVSRAAQCEQNDVETRGS